MVKEFCNGRKWEGSQERLFFTSGEAKSGCTLTLKNSFSEKCILNDHLVKSVAVRPLKSGDVDVYLV